MKSIRLYLLLTLIATIILVNFGSLLHGYQSSMAEAQKLFDDRLQSMAKLIAAANRDQVESSYFSEQKTPYVYFQVWNNDNTLISRSNNAPDTALSELTTGFYDVNFESYRWRNYVYHDKHLQRWIVAGERNDIRYILAERVVLESILPIVLAIPVAALIIWWVVGIGVRPLHQLAEQLNNKQAADLSPIMLEDTPKELSQLVQTTNQLFARLDDAFQRQQRFSADAAHELRTPISVLKVHLHNLQTELGDNNKDIILLQQGVERMGHVIKQLLALYRSSYDQATMIMTDIDLYSLAQNIIASDYSQFDTKRQTIVLKAEHVSIHGNQFALETLLHNLLTNASKYTPEKGDILVKIQATVSGPKLTVEDSGLGIPSDQYQRVFERFYRINGDRHESNVVGCGLGLAIVKHIVDLHHATISLSQSRFETGLKVTVNFPIQST